MATSDITEDKLVEWRVSMFEEMGFSFEDSEILAITRDTDGFLVDTHKVRRMLGLGCSPELALRILL